MHGLDSRETRQVVQLRMRSSQPVKDCITEVLRMRPTIEKHYLFIGSIEDEAVRARLDELVQAERDSILRTGVDSLGLRVTSGRLGRRFFSLVGDEHFDTSMKDIGGDRVEALLRAHVEETLWKARTRS